MFHLKFFEKHKHLYVDRSLWLAPSASFEPLDLDVEPETMSALTLRNTHIGT